MRRMSFALTTRQFLDGTKTVTRRLGWKFLKVGDHVMAIEKGMGLAKGEKQVELGEFVVVDVRREELCKITADDVRREGFGDMSADSFVEMFWREMKCHPRCEVTRIEFKRVTG